MISFPVIQFYFSPYIVVEAAAKGIVNASALVFVLLFAAGIFIGKAPCAWGMPCGALQEYAMGANDRKVGHDFRWIKWFIWAPWLAAVVILLMLAGGIRGVQPFYKFERGISVSETWLYGIYYGVIAVFLALSLTLGRRASCHVLCWMAPFMILGRRLGSAIKVPQLRVVANAAKCIDCKTCERSCPMSIDIVRSFNENGYVSDPECNLCGLCVRDCPKDVLRYRWG